MTADLHPLSLFFGLLLGALWLLWTGRLFWIVTASLWRRQDGSEPEDRLTRWDARFLGRLHITL